MKKVFVIVKWNDENGSIILQMSGFFTTRDAAEDWIKSFGVGSEEVLDLDLVA